MVQETLKRDPMSGHLFVFRGGGVGLIEVIWQNAQGACLFTKKWNAGATSGLRWSMARW